MEDFEDIAVLEKQFIREIVADMMELRTKRELADFFGIHWDSYKDKELLVDDLATHYGRVIKMAKGGKK